MITLDDVRKQLPDNAKWSCSFGNPGEGGYCEYHRTPDGKRWVIANGPHFLLPIEFDWHCVSIDD